MFENDMQAIAARISKFGETEESIQQLFGLGSSADRNDRQRAIKNALEGLSYITDTKNQINELSEKVKTEKTLSQQESEEVSQFIKNNTRVINEREKDVMRRLGANPLFIQSDTHSKFNELLTLSYLYNQGSQEINSFKKSLLAEIDCLDAHLFTLMKKWYQGEITEQEIAAANEYGAAIRSRKALCRGADSASSPGGVIDLNTADPTLRTKIADFAQRQRQSLERTRDNSQMNPASVSVVFYGLTANPPHKMHAEVPLSAIDARVKEHLNKHPLDEDAFVSTFLPTMLLVMPTKKTNGKDGFTEEALIARDKMLAAQFDNHFYTKMIDRVAELCKKQYPNSFRDWHEFAKLNICMHLSSLERNFNGVSYSVNTFGHLWDELREIKELRECVGQDSLKDLFEEKWYLSGYLLWLFQAQRQEKGEVSGLKLKDGVILAPRSDTTQQNTYEGATSSATLPYKTGVAVIPDFLQSEISSTKIRNDLITRDWRAVNQSVLLKVFNQLFPEKLGNAPLAGINNTAAPLIRVTSLNSIAFDLPFNSRQLIAAMEAATKAHLTRTNNSNAVGFSLHVISTMPLTGPSAQAFYQFVNNKQTGENLFAALKLCVELGTSTRDEFATLVSFPLYHPELPSPEDKPFYATAIIQEGKIIGLHLESKLPCPEAGPYDSRYFANWPFGQTQEIILNGQPIRVGTLTDWFETNNVIYATNAEQATLMSKKLPSVNTVVLNSAVESRVNPDDLPQMYKEKTVVEISPLGANSGDNVTSGSVVVCKEGQRSLLTSREEMYSFKPSVVTTLDPQSVLPAKALDSVKNSDAELRNRATSLWLRDYLRHTRQQGFVLSLSDGVNSAYTLMMISRAIDEAIIACGGLSAFFSNEDFSFLRCKEEVLKKLNTENEPTAILFLKSQLITCLYMPKNTQEEADSKMQSQMQSLAKEVGATFHCLELENIVANNVKNFKSGMANFDGTDNTQSPNLTPIWQRVRATSAGIFGNLENKMCFSTASATAAASNELHAGGSGQEGPVSLTLSLFQTYIIECTKLLADKTTNPAISEALNHIVTAAKEEANSKRLRLKELILEKMILQKLSPVATYDALLNSPDSLEDKEYPSLLLQEIDEVCEAWSLSQPSRVALAMAPNLGKLGQNVDRYRSVRTTRENHYFRNGRVELRIFAILGDTPENRILAREATSNPALIEYLLNTPFAEISKERIHELHTAFEKRQHLEQSQPSFDSPPKLAKIDNSVPRIAVATLHQKMFNYAHNIENIKTAIEKAEATKESILLLPELALTGYFGDGDFDWINCEEEGHRIFEKLWSIAQFAKDSPLIISVGVPVFIKGYDKPFVGQALLQNGEIKSISLKIVAPNGAAEFEELHFTTYDPYTMLDLNEVEFNVAGEIKRIPVGKPVTKLTDRTGNTVHIYHEQCAEAFPGVGAKTIDLALQEKRRYLFEVAKKHHDKKLIVLNPSASRVEAHLNKAELRRKLAENALLNATNIAACAYANEAGVGDGTTPTDGTTIVVTRSENNEQFLLHEGPRFSFSSGVGVSTTDIPQRLTFDQRLKDASKPLPIPQLKEEALYEEVLKAGSQWVLEFLRHHKKQCIVVSLSGGADSTFAATQTVASIDWFIQSQLSKLPDPKSNASVIENAKKEAVKKLINEYLAHLTCKEEILNTLENKGPEAAIKEIKNQILVCVYMPTANSSVETRIAAERAIKGGWLYEMENGHFKLKDPNGKHVEENFIPKEQVDGMGGRFVVIDQDEMIAGYILAQAGRSTNFATLIQDPEIIRVLRDHAERLQATPRWKEYKADITPNSVPQDIFEKLVVLYSEGKFYDESVTSADKKFPKELHPLLAREIFTWYNSDHDLAKQNVQARARTVTPWLVAERLNGLAVVSSNRTEIGTGYSTWAGDTSLGFENWLGGLPKSLVKRILRACEEGRVSFMEKLICLWHVNGFIPTAELRPLNVGNAATQTDEADFGMSYDNLDLLLDALITQRKSPKQVYEEFIGKINADGKLIFENAETLIRNIRKVCWSFFSSQYKRTGGGNTPFLGRNLDPHLSTETPLCAPFLQYQLLELILHVQCRESGHKLLSSEVSAILAKFNIGKRASLFNIFGESFGALLKALKYSVKKEPEANSSFTSEDKTLKDLINNTDPTKSQQLILCPGRHHITTTLHLEFYKGVIENLVKKAFETSKNADELKAKLSLQFVLLPEKISKDDSYYQPGCERVEVLNTILTSLKFEENCKAYLSDLVKKTIQSGKHKKFASAETVLSDIQVKFHVSDHSLTSSSSGITEDLSDIETAYRESHSGMTAVIAAGKDTVTRDKKTDKEFQGLAEKAIIYVAPVGNPQVEEKRYCHANKIRLVETNDSRDQMIPGVAYVTKEGHVYLLTNSNIFLNRMLDSSITAFDNFRNLFDHAKNALDQKFNEEADVTWSEYIMDAIKLLKVFKSAKRLKEITIVEEMPVKSKMEVDVAYVTQKGDVRIRLKNDDVLKGVLDSNITADDGFKQLFSSESIALSQKYKKENSKTWEEYLMDSIKSLTGYAYNLRQLKVILSSQPSDLPERYNVLEEHPIIPDDLNSGWVSNLYSKGAPTGSCTQVLELLLGAIKTAIFEKGILTSLASLDPDFFGAVQDKQSNVNKSKQQDKKLILVYYGTRVLTPVGLDVLISALSIPLRSLVASAKSIEDLEEGLLRLCPIVSLTSDAHAYSSGFNIPYETRRKITELFLTEFQKKFVEKYLPLIKTWKPALFKALQSDNHLRTVLNGAAPKAMVLSSEAHQKDACTVQTCHSLLSALPNEKPSTFIVVTHQSIERVAGWQLSDHLSDFSLICILPRKIQDLLGGGNVVERRVFRDSKLIPYIKFHAQPLSVEEVNVLPVDKDPKDPACEYQKVYIDPAGCYKLRYVAHKQGDGKNCLEDVTVEGMLLTLAEVPNQTNPSKAQRVIATLVEKEVIPDSQLKFLEVDGSAANDCTKLFRDCEYPECSDGKLLEKFEQQEKVLSILKEYYSDSSKSLPENARTTLIKFFGNHEITNKVLDIIRSASLHQHSASGGLGITVMDVVNSLSEEMDRMEAEDPKSPPPLSEDSAKLRSFIDKLAEHMMRATRQPGEKAGNSAHGSREPFQRKKPRPDEGSKTESTPVGALALGNSLSKAFVPTRHLEEKAGSSAKRPNYGAGRL